jgi:DNA-binding CsgD family transcriptional regulator
MARLSRIQEQVRSQVEQLTWSSLPPEPLGRRLLEVVRPAIPSDTQRLFGVDPASLLMNRLLAVGAGEDLSRSLHWLERTYLVGEPSPVTTFPALMRMSLPAVSFHDRLDRLWGLPPGAIRDLTDREFTRIYHEIETPAGGILRGCFAVDGRWVAALQFGRFDPGAGFRPTEVAFLRLLAPTIGRALGSALIREQAMKAEAAAPDAPGIVVLSPDGQVRLCTPAAEAWFGALRDQREPVAPGVAALPVPVLAAAAHHRSRKGDGQGGRIRVATRAGPLRVEAASGGPDGSIAIVLSAEPEPALPAVPEWWPLTAQERATVTLAIQGLRNRQIAGRLVVTENTVQTHLARAYDKLGVSGRGQLLSRLFHDACLPGFMLPDPMVSGKPGSVGAAD